MDNPRECPNLCENGYFNPQGTYRFEECPLHPPTALDRMAMAFAVKHLRDTRPHQEASTKEGWRPIETAPIGECVLLWCELASRAAIYYKSGGEWQAVNEGCPLISPPLAWMPLPAPPALAAPAAKEGDSDAH